MKNKVCIVGGGNIGLYLSCELSELNPVLYCSKPESRNKEYECINVLEKKEKKVYLDKMTNNLSEAVKNKRLIIVTFPANVRIKFLDDLLKVIEKKTIICFITGFGGAELLANKFLEKDCIITGFQRSPYICRSEQNKVYLLGKRKEVYLGSIPFDEVFLAKEVLSKTLNLNIKCVPNYLSVTFTPTNPIMHVPRLYQMYKKYEEGVFYKEEFFYEEWTDEASSIILKCEEEMNTFIKKLKNIDKKGMHSVFKYFGAETVKEYTQKMKEFPGFKGIKAPVKFEKKGYIPNFESRYFLEDIPYGLVLYKSFFKLSNFKSEEIDNLIKFFQKYLNKNYIDENGNLGEDAKDILKPQDVGINTIEELEEFYMQSNRLKTLEEKKNFIKNNFLEELNIRETIKLGGK